MHSSGRASQAVEGFEEGHLRILCVDDCIKFLTELKSTLGKNGIEVVTATHGIDAIMQFRGHDGRFTALIIAHELSGMNGASLATRLSALGCKGPVLVTARSLGLAEMRANIHLPVAGFFNKPFDISTLVTLLLRMSKQAEKSERLRTVTHRNIIDHF